MGNIVDRLEYTTAQDKFYSYCLWEYKPVASPDNKFRSANLLYHSFDFAGIDERIFEVVSAIRKAIGFDMTVWGVKLLGDDLGWEFYFYDYERRKRERSITRVLDAIRPYIPCTIRANENDFYFMFSIDIDNDIVSGNQDLEMIHMYIGNPGSTVSSGISYSLTDNGRRLENYYFFFDPKTQLNEVIGKVNCSAFIDTTVIGIDSILWPELRKCHTICIANKQHNDCAYFSGINVDQFLFFLRKMDYPRRIVSYVEENRGVLDHILYDVGIDYRMEGGELVVLKSGYYGTF